MWYYTAHRVKYFELRGNILFVNGCTEVEPILIALGFIVSDWLKAEEQ
jgi:hypothetical protein